MSASANGPVDPDGHTIITPEYIQALTEAATDALTSPNRPTREAASDRLIFLSSFDNWESTTKRLLPYCTDNCLRFIVCKAIYFMVANELGPVERAEMKLYALDYCRSRRMAGEVMPTYVQRELYLIYACALFSNWKIAIISEMNNPHGRSGRFGGSGSGASSLDELDGSAQGPSTPTAFELAAQMVEELKAYLTTEEMLDCLCEVIAYFSQHVAKAAIPSLRSAFVHTILPYFFETAAQSLEGAAHQAGEVCCATLECMSPLSNSGGLLTVKYTTEATIHILRWADGWASSLQIALEYVSGYLCSYPTGPQARLMGRLAHLCSRIDSPHEQFVRDSREAFATKLLQVSMNLLSTCRRASSCVPDLLTLSCEIFVNTFERHEEAAVAFTAANFPDVIQAWADATQYVLGRFDEEEDTPRQLLLHLFYLFADRLLPRRVAQQRRGGITGQDAMNRAFCGELPPAPAPDIVQSYVEVGGQLGAAHSQRLAYVVKDFFDAYLTAVVDKAHLREDAEELRFESGVTLYNERTLLPLAEMLYCDTMQFLPTVMDRLRVAIEDFQVCAGARDSALRSGGMSLPTEETVARLTAMITRADANMIRGLLFCSEGGGEPDVETLFRNFHQSTLSHFLMRSSLSRLSMLISIFAVAMQRNTHATSDDVLTAIGGFARRLLTEDDSLTTEMLRTLNFNDIDSSDDLDSGESNANTATPVTPSLHIGILRSLFFFCNCVFESSFDRRPEFIDIMLDLLRFVYLHHSEQAALVADANALLKRVVTEGPTTTYLLTSAKLAAVVQAVEEDAITGLRLPPPLTGPPLPQAARNGFYTALTSFVETRFYAGYGNARVVHTVLARALAPQRLECFPLVTLEEVIATTRGVQQPDTLLVALDAAMGSREALLGVVMRTDAAAAALVMKWFSVLCVLARSLLEEDASSTTQWDLSSLILRGGVTYLGLVSRGVPGPQVVIDGDGYHPLVTPFYSFPADAVEAEVVYDLADMLLVLCTAPWCNLGVIVHYERATVERFFCGALQLLTSVSPPLLLSSERGKRSVFGALITALTTEGQVFESLHLLMMRQRIWPQVLEHLTRCLSYDYVPEVLQAILLLVRQDMRGRQSVPNYQGISERTLAAAFHEVAVLVAVAPYLEMRQLTFVFDVLRICYTLAKEPCTDRMKVLLGFCSAYHRVRLRTIWSMLMSEEPDMLERYVSVFGQSSKVAVLSAW